MEVQDSILSVEELLSRSAAAAKSKSSTKNMSAVQKLLAQNGEPEDTVQLSPVAKLLKAEEARNPKKKESYFESDDYLRAKVSQLKAQISVYTNLPGLDPSGAVMDALTKEVNDLVRKQQAKLKEANDAAAVKQKELDAKRAEEALIKSIPSADQLIKRAKARLNGEEVPDFADTLVTNKEKDAAVAALLKKAKEAVSGA